MTRLTLTALTLCLTLPHAALAQDALLQEFNTSRLETTMGFDQELQHVAFKFLNGKTKAEAEAFLHSEKFRCFENVCERVILDKETSHDINNSSDPNKGQVFGLRHTARATFSVELLADVIKMPQDLRANFLYEIGKVPWHRRPKDSDFTVRYD
ncbi:hypothetical protein DS909_16620 [Phaeobacter gallaeciensis]|uniref:Uncharacterized protein n=2 Tax=Roseobacteraceae TaxID=2854170 RepID=A0A366WTL8_9RHOB|nr:MULTISPECIES: hypothetical protein [Roseobacteraceae]MBT3140911.1 hypothetical protein [Falsiruegeria litorea]MBT8170655.1 hypothetical protein [Falsiruegeria litorea]RBW52856.1 hypothetical protein DS909_16620 [Phaeobacter gallaeciensis]